MAEARRAGLGGYLREAFLFRWNLLAVIGGVGAAALSPFAPVALPLVAAAELTYLAGMVSLPRFRKAVDARRAAGARVPAAEGGGTARLEQLLASLSHEGRERFEQLRERCVRMRSLARGARGRSGPGPEQGDELQSPALDRMLWVFLRLLHAQDALRLFLRAVPERELEERVEALRRELEQAQQAQQARDERIARSLTDSLASAQVRLDNHRTAKQNERFVGVELDRIEQKIQMLSEQAVNRQDPDLLSSQVDSAAESVRQAEKTIGDLQAITGIAEDLAEPPAILSSRFEEVEKR